MFLSENEGCSKTDLYGAVSYTVRMPEKLDRLESAGLIVQEPAARGTGTFLSLTEAGRMVCEAIEGIEVILDPEVRT